MENLIDVLGKFSIPESKYTFQVISNGFINDTYLVLKENEPIYLLQKINTDVFQNFESIFQNLKIVLPLLDAENYKKIELVNVKSGKSYLKTNESRVWRLMTFIKDSLVFNITSNTKVAYEAGKIIGLFHKLTQPVKIDTLQEIIPKFHNVAFRYNQFNEALKTADQHRIKNAEKAIKFVEKTISIVKRIKLEELPVRVCHNDTKLNNILFSSNNKALCLIDLDTIMPGTILYDFGDAVRTIVNQAPEDVRDLSKINFSIDLFESFVDGFATHTNFLTVEEIELLPTGVILMPFLHGIRALTDYLENNKYYKVTYETQNLDRSLSLFQFAQLAVDNQLSMAKIMKEKIEF